MQAYSEIIVREKAYEPRYFIRVRMLIVWRREEDVLRLRLESIGSGRGCGEGRGRKGPLPRTTSASHDLRRMPDFSPPLSAAKKPAQGGPLLAQRRGFEPPDESPPSHDFQSCSLNHSDISAWNKSHFTTIPGKMQLLFGRFRDFFGAKYIFLSVSGKSCRQGEEIYRKKVNFSEN